MSNRMIIAILGVLAACAVSALLPVTNSGLARAQSPLDESGPRYLGEPPAESADEEPEAAPTTETLATSNTWLPGLTCLPPMRLPVALDDDLDAEALRPGDQFTFSVLTSESAGGFSQPAQLSAASLPRGCRVVARVVGTPNGLDGRPAVAFKVTRLFIPREDVNWSIPLRGAQLEAPSPGAFTTDLLADYPGRFAELGSALGQLAFGNSGTFNGSAVGHLAGIFVSGLIGSERNVQMFSGHVSKDACSDLVLTRSIYF